MADFSISDALPKARKVFVVTVLRDGYDDYLPHFAHTSLVNAENHEQQLRQYGWVKDVCIIDSFCL